MKKRNKKEIIEWCDGKKFTPKDNFVKDMINNRLKNKNALLLSSEVNTLGGTKYSDLWDKCHKDASFVNLGIEEVPTFNFPALPKLLYEIIEYSEKNQEFNRVKLIEYTLEENRDTYISTSYHFKKENILEEWNKIIEGKLFLPIEKIPIIDYHHYGGLELSYSSDITGSNIIAEISDISIVTTDTTISIYGKINYNKKFWELGLRELTDKNILLVFTRQYFPHDDNTMILSKIERIIKFILN